MGEKEIIERIEELEKKPCMQITEIFTSEEVKELKKSHIYQTILEMHRKEIDENEEQIAELRERLDTRFIEDTGEIVSLREQLNELREHEFIGNNGDILCNPTKSEYLDLLRRNLTNQEVLRKLFDWKVEKGESAIEAIESGKMENMVNFMRDDIAFYKKLLEGLEGTKDPNELTPKELHERLMIDSGDEKSVQTSPIDTSRVGLEGGETLNVRRHLPNDSKAPEPFKCKSCQRDSCIIQGKNVNACPLYIAPSENEVPCPICGNHISKIELEAFNVCKSIVKREDLQRIFELSEYKNLDYPYNEEMKRIKEEYKIE